MIIIQLRGIHQNTMLLPYDTVTVPWYHHSTFLWEITTSTSSSIKFHFLSHTRSWISVNDQTRMTHVLRVVRDVSFERWVGKPWGYDIRWSHGENPIEAMIKFLWLKSTVRESSWMETRASTHLHLIKDTAKIKSVSAHTRYKLHCTRDSYWWDKQDSHMNITMKNSYQELANEF